MWDILKARCDDPGKSSKFSVRFWNGIALGYVNQTTNMWKFRDPIAKKTTDVSDVEFDESKIMADRSTGLLDVLKSAIPVEEPKESDDFGDRPDAMPLPPKPVQARHILQPAMSAATEDPPPDSEMEDAIPTPLSRLSTLATHRSLRIGFLGGRVRAAAAAVTSGGHGDPASYRDTIPHPDAVKWKETTKEEYLSLGENSTWMYVSYPKRLQNGCSGPRSTTTAAGDLKHT